MGRPTKEKDTIWMKVTKDKFEFPLAMASTAVELSKITGVHRTTIHRAVNKEMSGFVKVEVNADDEIERALFHRGQMYAEVAERELKKNGESGAYIHASGIVQGIRVAIYECIRVRGAKHTSSLKECCANCRHEYKDYGMEFCKKHENPMEDTFKEKCCDYKKEVDY